MSWAYDDDDVLEVTSEFSRDPCYEHKERDCKKHMAASYPKTAVGFHAMRLGLGVLFTSIVGAAGLGLWWLITTYGMLVAYAPLGIFFSGVALYGLGWGVMACYRLGKKSSGT